MISIILGILVYLSFGMSVLFLLRDSSDTEFYLELCKKPRAYRITVKLLVIVFWIIIIASILLCAIYEFIVFIIKTIIE